MREFIQQKLEEIQDIEVTSEVPDDMLEVGKTYFSFTLEENFLNSDLNDNYTYQPSIVGYVKRKVSPTEDTLLIVDNARKAICSKLKEIKIKSSYRDVTVLDTIRKEMITGNVKYNEINKELV